MQICVVPVDPLCLVDIEPLSGLVHHCFLLEATSRVVKHIHVDFDDIGLYSLARFGLDFVGLRVAREGEVLAIELRGLF